MKVTKGDFREYGARWKNGGVMLTVSVTQGVKNASVILYTKENKKISRIALTPEYAIGRVYSLFISDINPSEVYYLLEEDGKKRLDPYASSVVGRDKWGEKEIRKKHNFRVGSGINDLNKSWKDTSVDIHPCDAVMYKLHMRGFTAGFGMAESKIGSYKGVLSKLSYLKDMGVTSLELMPLYDFEELFLEERQHIGAKGDTRLLTEYTNKINFWGYGEASYYAPKASYFGGAANAVAGLRDFVSTIHKNGMELIMEMSFGQEHTGDFIVDCLCYYVRYFHIDGFHIIGCNAPIERIAQEPFLQNTKIFYEYIPEEVLSNEKGKKHLFMYNDSFMVVTRQLQNHMNGSMQQFANHMRRQNSAYGFVNYMANVCGFSLFDSYSYGEKHNQENGEDNKDGTNTNFSFNYGVEGATNNKAITAKRFLEMRNGFTATIMSQAIPLFVAGDEFACSHNGNNNPYCQDNKVGYTVFARTKNKKLLQQYVKELIKFRKKHSCIRPENAFSMNDYLHKGLPDMSFHATEPWTMYIGDEQKALGVLYSGAYAKENEEVFICYNFHYDEVEMALPLLEPGKRWRKVVNTFEFNENTDFTPKAIDNQQSIKVPGSSITILVGLKP